MDQRTKRNKYLLAKYGITIEIYDAMLKYNDGKCWICHRKPKPGKNLNVDHQHLTKAEKKAGAVFGKVRGLLCFFCNKYLIGRRKAEHAYLFKNAAAYLSSNFDCRTWRITDETKNTPTSQPRTKKTRVPKEPGTA